MNHRVSCLLAVILVLARPLFSQDHHVRIAFIGNSVTIGVGLSDPVNDCYPSQLGDMLQEIYGDTCIISNFAVSGRTMLKQGDYPIWDESAFTSCLNQASDIFVILLGTNDTKSQNWDVYGDQFHADYLSMIDTLQKANPMARFLLCYPPPAFQFVWGIRNSIIVDEIIPVIDSISRERSVNIVDFYHPFLDSASLFPDNIHPNPEGAAAMARLLFDIIEDSDLVHQAKLPYNTPVVNRLADHFKVYPNPFDSDIYIEYSEAQNEQSEYSIMDISGRIIQSASLDEDNSGDQVRNIHTAELKKGVYILEIRNPDHRQSVILIK